MSRFNSPREAGVSTALYRLPSFSSPAERHARADFFDHSLQRYQEHLAEWVLRDQPEWTRARIEAAMHAREERTVKLKAPLPVHIGYWTAWVQPDGTVIFTDDPYGIDSAHASAIARRPKISS